MSKVIAMKNVNFDYEKRNILKDINFEINCGEYVGIVGENGSGKSTLLNLMLGNLKATKGQVDLCENRIGYLSQEVRNFNKKFPATVKEIISGNLYSEMGIFKILKKKHKEKIREVLEIVKMESYKDRLIGNLSGGQQQRVFLARLLINNPKLIFMDEPIVGLDDESINMFYRLMDRLNKELNITIVMVTHDIKTMEKKADRIIYLNDSVMTVKNLKQEKLMMKNKDNKSGSFTKTINNML